METAKKVEEPDLLTGDDPHYGRLPTPKPDGFHLETKTGPTVETIELEVENHGHHIEKDLSRRASPALIIGEEAEVEADASGELRSILSQKYPTTPGALSTHSRRQSFSFTKKPTPEPDQPFDFNRFQEQLRSKTAEPVAKYLKSFLHEFSRRQWNSTEQQKIVHDFLDFIRTKMLVYEPFKSASTVEFDNALEGMEKLVMNRLYPDLFPPLIVQKMGKTATHRMGHSEDLDRDQILADKIRIYSWIQEPHLDIQPGPMNDRFLGLAGIEINKLDQYRAPRDKIICVLNCCKVIFGLLRSAGDDESADKFVPLLILTLLRSNTLNLCSHVSFIQRFRNPDKLFGEAGYYLSSLCGAINFIEALDRKSLTISDSDYDAAVEISVQRIKLEESVLPPSPMTPVAPKAGLQLPSKDLVFERASGLLNIAKPSLSSIGRLFSQDGNVRDITSNQEPNRGTRKSMEDYSRTTESASRSYIESGAFGNGAYTNDQTDSQRPKTPARPPSSLRPVFSSSAPSNIQSPTSVPTFSLSPAKTVATPTPRVEISAHEASAAKAKDRAETLATLSAMFENIEMSVIEMVLDEKRGRVGASIDALLELSG